MNRRGMVIGGLLAGILLVSVAAQSRLLTLQEALAVPRNDSTAVIVYVQNYTSKPQQVFIGIGLRYTSIGVAAPNRTRVFVVPSASLGTAPRITVAIVQDTLTDPVTMPPIVREPGQGNFIVVSVGQPDAPAKPRGSMS